MNLINRLQKYRFSKQSKDYFDYLKALGEKEFNRIKKIYERERFLWNS